MTALLKDCCSEAETLPVVLGGETELLLSGGPDSEGMEG